MYGARPGAAAMTASKSAMEPSTSPCVNFAMPRRVSKDAGSTPAARAGAALEKDIAAAAPQARSASRRPRV